MNHQTNRPRNPMTHSLNVTVVTDREEIARAFGDRAAWQATITKLTHKEAKETDARKKRHLRLMLLNAQTQLALASE